MQIFGQFMYNMHIFYEVMISLYPIPENLLLKCHSHCLKNTTWLQTLKSELFILLLFILLFIFNCSEISSISKHKNKRKRH